MPSKVARRPVSPTGSVCSVASARSTCSRFDDEGTTVDDCVEYVGRPHRSWDSAIKEMARIEARAAEVQSRCSDTASNASGVSCYSVKSNMSRASTVRSVSATAPNKPMKGKMRMLPLGARTPSAEPLRQRPQEADELSLGGASLSVRGRKDAASAASTPAATPGRRPPVPPASDAPAQPPPSKFVFSSGPTPAFVPTVKPRRR